MEAVDAALVDFFFFVSFRVVARRGSSRLAGTRRKATTARRHDDLDARSGDLRGRRRGVLIQGKPVAIETLGDYVYLILFPTLPRFAGEGSCAASVGSRRGD